MASEDARIVPSKQSVLIGTYDNSGTDEARRVAVDSNGYLLSTVALTGDVQIGAVEIKNGSSDQRATVNSSGELLVSDDSVGATATLSNVNDSASSATLLAAAATRRGAIVVNDSTADLYLKYGATASATSFTVKIPSGGGYWEMPKPIYKGIIDGIWSADASGAARITELT